MTIRTDVIVVFYLSILRTFAWDQIPPLPVGRRVQYYFLNTNGNYKYGYDTGDGQTAVVSSNLGNEVRNEYVYSDEHGKTQGLAAGDTGFISRATGMKNHGSSLTDSNFKQNQQFDSSYSLGSHQRQEEKDSKGHYAYTNNVGSNKGLDIGYNGLSSTSHAGTGKGFVTSGMQLSTPVSSNNNKKYFNNLQTNSKDELPLATVATDGSYSFSYETGDQSRTETADSNGNVKGSYSFINKDDNIRRVINYEAGANKGFVTRQEYFPNNLPTANVFSSNNNDCKQQKYFGNLPGYCQQLASKQSSDKSYAFGYKTSDASRQESSDVSGNVKGSYSFVSKDGVRRRIEYEAGAGKGFVARGSHLPVPPADSSSQSIYPSVTNNLGSEDSQSSVGGLTDGSYSFEYETPDASRQESSDASGNVKGSYSFISKDGVRRRIDYEAGAGKGFVARGSHLPVPPVEPPLQSTFTTITNGLGSAKANKGLSSIRGFTDGSYSFGYETYDASRQESSDVNGNVKGSYSFVPKDGVRRRIDYEADGDKGFVARGLHLPVPPVDSSAKSTYTTATNSLGSERQSSVGGFTDGSYSFGYETSDDSRQESSDVSGNVKGSDTFISKDGIRRKTDYEAGAGKGFVTEGSHLPIAPLADTVGSLKNIYSTVSTSQTLSSFDDNSEKVSDYVLRTYLPPTNKNKFGYIFESSH